MQQPNIVTSEAQRGAVEAICVRCSAKLLVGAQAKGWHVQVGEVMGPLCPRCSHIVERQQLAAKNPKLFPAMKIATRGQMISMHLQPLLLGSLSLLWIHTLPLLFSRWIPWGVLSACWGGMLFFYLSHGAFRERAFGLCNPEKFRRSPFVAAGSNWKLVLGAMTALYQLDQRAAGLQGEWTEACCLLIFTLLSLILLFKCAVSDPGVLPAAKGGGTAAARGTTPGAEDKDVCDMCGAREMQRSFHCNTLGVCVDEFDRYLDMINNAVGLKNRGLVFLTMVCVTFTHYLFMRVGASAVVGRPVSSFALGDLLRVIVYGWDATFAVVVFYTNVHSVWRAGNEVLISAKAAVKNITTRETYQWMDLEYLVREGREGRVRMHNPFDKGLLANCKQFFQPRPSLLHVVSSEGSGASSSSSGGGGGGASSSGGHVEASPV